MTHFPPVAFQRVAFLPFHPVLDPQLSCNRPPINSSHPAFYYPPPVPAPPVMHSPSAFFKMRQPSETQQDSKSLLTPPLTPSSSIRTTESIDSTVTVSTSSIDTDDLHSDGRLLVGNETGSSRFLLVSGMPPNVPPAMLKMAFTSVLCRNRPEDGSSTDEHRYIQAVNIHPSLLGSVILAFWDLRDAARARTACLKGEVDVMGARLNCRFVTVEELRTMIGHSNMGTTGRLRVQVEPLSDTGDELTYPFVEISKVRSVLAGFGGLRSFEELHEANQSAFLVEYYDVRDRDSVLNDLSGQTMFDMRFWVSSVDDGVYDPSYNLADVKVSPGLAGPFYGPLVPQLSIMIPTSPMIPSPAYYSPAASSPQSPQMYYPPPFQAIYPHMPPAMQYQPFEYPVSPPPLEAQPPNMPSVATITDDLDKLTVSPTSAATQPRTSRPPPNPSVRGNLSSREASRKSATATAAPATEVSDKNQVSVERIEGGQDTRTTVMIKNIPNKMSSKDLIKFIEDVCPRAVDFVYLRIDFANGCNVGYAFVNFIKIEDLVKFTKAKLGEKWNMFSSEKVLQMCYATYQGKEALIEKFKNSCIMDEREEWRPKVFYSEGPNEGLPEPFPAPTHLRRKERSSFNRGALYAPGAFPPGANAPHRRLKEWPTSSHRNNTPVAKKAVQ